MEYPPISHLISSTFDGLLNNKELSRTLETPAKAPQPVASSEAADAGDTLGVGSSATSGTNEIGSILNTVA